jgi:hypothetical protein
MKGFRLGVPLIKLSFSHLSSLNSAPENAHVFFGVSHINLAVFLKKSEKLVDIFQILFIRLKCRYMQKS